MSAHIASMNGPVSGTVMVSAGRLCALLRAWPTVRDLSEPIDRYDRTNSTAEPFDGLPAARSVLYVFVDSDDRALYVGMTARTDGLAAARFPGHHALTGDVDGVWITVLRDTLTRTDILNVERWMIRELLPPLNVQHRVANHS